MKREHKYQDDLELSNANLKKKETSKRTRTRA
jgi:hypothetical protein